MAAQWCWDAGHKKDERVWTPYDAKTQAKIERGKNTGRKEIDVEIQGKFYIIAFDGPHGKSGYENFPGRQINDTDRKKRFFMKTAPGVNTHLAAKGRAMYSRVGLDGMSAGSQVHGGRTPARAQVRDGVRAPAPAPAPGVPVRATEPAPAPAPAVLADKVWCWDSSGHTSGAAVWVPYGASEAAIIEAADANRQNEARITIKGSPYILNFETMLQMSEMTYGSRRFKKTVPTGASTGAGRRTNTSPGGRNAVIWQWNSSTPRNPMWTDYDAMAIRTIEAGYQKYIKAGQGSRGIFGFGGGAEGICTFRISNGMQMEIDFETNRQRSRSGFRHVQRINRPVGGAAPTTRPGGRGQRPAPRRAIAAGMVAVVLGDDGVAKTVPTKTTTDLAQGAMVSFKLSVRSTFGGTFLKDCRGTVTSMKSNKAGTVPVFCATDGRTYDCAAKFLTVVPLVKVADMPPWQQKGAAAAAAAARPQKFPEECQVKTTRYTKDYYGDVVTTVEEKVVPATQLVCTLQAKPAVGQSIRALWQLSEMKVFKGVIAKHNTDGTMAIKYADGDFKPRCKLSWIMTEAPVSFDPAKMSKGMSVLVRPQKKHQQWAVGIYQGVVPAPRIPTTPNAAINRIIRVWKGDVTQLQVDAVQNAANAGLWAGAGLCGAIHKAAGPKLAEECRTFPVLRKKAQSTYSDAFGVRPSGFEGDRCQEGDTVMTKAYELPAKMVMHTVGPIGVKPAVLRSAYRSALKKATDNGARSLALCCISTGIYGYSLPQATPVAMSAVREWLEEGTNVTKLDAVIFCVFQPKELDLYSQYLPTFFPPASAAAFSALPPLKMIAARVPAQDTHETSELTGGPSAERRGWREQEERY